MKSKKEKLQKLGKLTFLSMITHLNLENRALVQIQNQEEMSTFLSAEDEGDTANHGIQVCRAL